jgi:hypothetical protein
MTLMQADLEFEYP